MGSDSILPHIGMLINLRQWSVIADRTVKYKRYAVFYAGINDSVTDSFLLDKSRNRTVGVDTVDGVQMVIMPVSMRHLCFNVCSQRSAQISALQIMGCQSVSGKNRADISVVDQFFVTLSGPAVKGAGRSQHPYHIAAVTLFILKQFHQLLIVITETGLTASALSEGKGGSLGFFRSFKTVCMYIYAFAAVFGTTDHHLISLFQVSELTHMDFSVFKYRYTVHTAVLRQVPFPRHFEILRKNRSGMKPGRSRLVHRSGNQFCIWRLHELLLRKIRFYIFW